MRSSSNKLVIVLIVLVAFLIVIHLRWLWLYNRPETFRLLPPNQKPNQKPYQVVPSGAAASSQSRLVTPRMRTATPARSQDSVEPTPLLSVSLDNGEWTTDKMRDRYFAEVMRVHVRCGKMMRVGRSGDGGWDVCMDKGLKLQPGCLVYSFGVGNIWEFDEQLSGPYHCTVRAFDPTMGKPKHIHRPGKVHFYPIGIGGQPNNTQGRFPTQNLRSFLTQFGEADRTLDLLKIDVEYSEWESLESIIKDGLLTKVKQLLMEYHTREVTGSVSSLDDYRRFLKIMQTLEKAGLRKFKASKNNAGIGDFKDALRRGGIHTPRLMSQSCCHEVYYINTNYL